MTLLSASLGCATSLAGAEPTAPTTGPPALSRLPQLFLDDYVVARMVNLERVLQRPVKRRLLGLEPEHPWELGQRMDMGQVIYDDDAAKFRLWYTALMSKETYADNYGYCCYAESEDGVSWAKPMLDIHDFEGTKPTNIVSKGPSDTSDHECLFASVIKTPHDPATPYKMLFTHRGGPANPHYGLNVSTSLDGVHWTEPRTIYHGKCDCPPSLEWYEPLQQYFAFTRSQTQYKGSGYWRVTGILTSKDWTQWTERKKVNIADEQDNFPMTQVHHLIVSQYGDLLIGMASMLHTVKGSKENATWDVQLVCSRDGWTWSRVANRTVFLEHLALPSSRFVVADGTAYVYFRGETGLATLPADRFVAVQCVYPDKEGLLDTKAFRCRGRELFVNAEIGEGRLRVSVLDENGEVLPHFGESRSRLAKYDKLHYRVFWTGEEGRRCLADAADSGKPVALRFHLDKAKLFAFQIKDLKR